MKPDTYMPFYGDDFFQAVEGHTELVQIAYLRAIWHYWSHAHCKGLRDDQEFLRRLCRIEKGDWEYVREIIFDNDKCFSIGEDGLWHQKRAAVLWAEAKLKYDRAVAAGLKGSEKRWGKTPPKRKK